jgi:hypothetical protein
MKLWTIKEERLFCARFYVEQKKTIVEEKF